MFRCMLKSPLSSFSSDKGSGGTPPTNEYFAELTFIAGELDDNKGFAHNHSAGPFYNVGTLVSSYPANLIPEDYVPRWILATQLADQDEVIVSFSGTEEAMEDFIAEGQSPTVIVSFHKGDDLLASVTATIGRYGPGYVTIFTGDPGEPVLVPLVLGDTYTVRFKKV